MLPSSLVEAIRFSLTLTTLLKFSHPVVFRHCCSPRFCSRRRALGSRAGVRDSAGRIVPVGRQTVRGGGSIRRLRGGLPAGPRNIAVLNSVRGQRILRVFHARN